MIVKQKNLRVFHIHIEKKEKFFEYFEKNKILLKEFFLLIDGEVDEQICDTLKKESICFTNINNCKVKLSNVKKELTTPKIEKKEELKDKPVQSLPSEKLKIYERPIRSGEEITEELPMVVFGRINSGAKVFSSQSVSIYGIIDGLVQCDGDFVVLNGIGQAGNLIFNGEIIDKDILKKDVLQKITMSNNVIKVKEI